MKTGLIMEGGAMRGMFTAGVLDVLMTNHITFDGAIGVSAGAAFGCNLKSQQIGRVIRYNTMHAHDPKFCSARSWLRTGDLYGGRYCYEILPEKLDIFDTEAYVNNPMDFYAVCTDAKTGEAVYHKCDTGVGDDLLYIRGSASMPGVSKPVKVDGRLLLDGGISDSIPLKWFEEQGYDRIVLLLTQPIDYRKKAHSPSTQKALKAAMLKYPNVYKRLLNRHEEYNAAVEEILKKEAEGKVLVIRPEASLHIGPICHDPKELNRVYRHGIEVAEKQLEDIKEFLSRP